MDVRIEALHLRVPGLSAEAAGQLGDVVARRLAARLPADWRPVALGEVALRLELPASTPRDRLAELIVEALWQQLRRQAAAGM